MPHALERKSGNFLRLCRKPWDILQKNVLCKAGLALVVLAGVGISPAHAQYSGQVSTFVTDANTGEVLSQQRADLQRYPASLTKMMTLYMTFRALRANAISLGQTVPVSIHASSMEPSKLGLVPGSYLTVQQGILALVTKSANDAACALGEFIGGGDEGRFAQMMTQQARALGMRDTTFRNASGLPDPDQVTTARDLATLAYHLIKDFPEYYHYFSVPGFSYHGRYIRNHDTLLTLYPGADGLKTGYTASAGHNLVSSAVRGNVRLIGVVLGARSNSSRTALMVNLLDDGFARKGIAPVPRSVVMASDTPHRRARGSRHYRRSSVALAAARRSASGPLQVAEASGPVRHGRRAEPHKRSAAVHKKNVKLVTAKHPGHAASRKKHNKRS